MKVLAISRMLPTATEELYMTHRLQEIRKAWEIYTTGPVREMYFCTDRPVAVLTLECDTVEAARDVLAELPLVQEGVIEWDFYPLGPFYLFSELFGSWPSG